MKTMLGAAALALAMVTGAHASVIPVMTGITPAGSNFQYNYTASLAPDQGLKTGDRLVILDFMGYVSGSVQSTNADWSASVSNTLPSGLLILPSAIDNALIPDLVFTYIGSNLQTSGGPYASQIDYSGLSAISTLSQSVLGSFSAEAIKNTGLASGSLTFNVGSVSVPSAVPEPASWALMMIGLGGMGLMLRNRRSGALATAA